MGGRLYVRWNDPHRRPFTGPVTTMGSTRGTSVMLPPVSRQNVNVYRSDRAIVGSASK